MTFFPTTHRVGEQQLDCSKIVALAFALMTMAGVTTAALAQVPLKTYADEKGYVNIRTLTCSQLAGTFQDDADLLGVWYSGWFNGHNKKHMINVKRTKAGIHQVIVYCKANPDKNVIDAVELALGGQ